MPVRSRLWLSLFVSLMAAGAAAQDTAVFVGQWVLPDPSDVASDIAEELTVRQASEGRLDVMTVERRSKGGVRSDSYTIGIQGGTVGGMDRSGRGTGPNGQV